MSWITNYDAAQRELLMQKVQMQMSERRFCHVLGVEETAVVAWQRNMVPMKPKQVLLL